MTKHQKRRAAAHRAREQLRHMERREREPETVKLYGAALNSFLNGKYRDKGQIKTLRECCASRGWEPGETCRFERNGVIYEFTLPETAAE